jgi:hypothetical protein
VLERPEPPFTNDDGDGINEDYCLYLKWLGTAASNWHNRPEVGYASQSNDDKND